MDKIKKELERALDEMKDMIIKALDAVYANGYDDGFLAAMEAIAKIIDDETREDDERRPS